MWRKFVALMIVAAVPLTVAPGVDASPPSGPTDTKFTLVFELKKRVDHQHRYTLFIRIFTEDDKAAGSGTLRCKRRFGRAS
jgi:hypothetical protein